MFNTEEHHRPPISPFYPWYNTTVQFYAKMGYGSSFPHCKLPEVGVLDQPISSMECEEYQSPSVDTYDQIWWC